MRKFMSQAKSAFQDIQSSTANSTSSSPSSTPPITKQKPLTIGAHQPSTIQPPDAQDILRYRYHHGVNLGSIFVLEKWLHGSMFPSSAAGGSELDAVTASIREIGLDRTRDKWEAHWRDAVSDNAWGWFVNEARGTSVRLPVGYFTLGEEFCRGTPFEDVRGVYVHAWEYVKRFVHSARERGVGVLIDLHAVPGGANKDAHSGCATGRAELWGSRRNCAHARDVLGRIARECRDLDGVIGIQVVNEAEWNAGKKGMYEWYEEVIAEIARADPSMPVYISDAWELDKCLEWCTRRRGASGNPVVVDTHKYYTFADKHKSQSPQQLIGLVSGELSELDGKEGSIADRGAAQLVIGEWSCVMDGQTWARVGGGEKPELVQQFGRAQSQRWQSRAGGSFFWTWKMDWMDGGGWGFVEQTKKGHILPPLYLSLPAQEVLSRAQKAQDQRQQLASSARHGHEQYWNHTSPGKSFEHQLYSEGWDVGFSDALTFFTTRAEGRMPGGRLPRDGGDKIGCLEIWTRKRLLESGRRGEFVWEWEQGFRGGVKALEGLVGI